MRRLVHLHQGLAIHNSPTKIIEAIAASCLLDVKLLVEHIRRDVVGQLPKRNRALLRRRKSGFANVISLILEVFITSLQR